MKKEKQKEYHGFRNEQDLLDRILPRRRPRFHVVNLPGKKLKKPRKKIVKAKKLKPNPIKKPRRSIVCVRRVPHPKTKSRKILRGTRGR